MLEFNYALWLTLSVSTVPIWHLWPRSPNYGLGLPRRAFALERGMDHFGQIFSLPQNFVVATQIVILRGKFYKS